MKRKLYVNQNTETRSNSATDAKQWHDAGDDIAVKTMRKNGDCVRVVWITGAKVETRQEKTNRENWEHCKHIAEELEYYADGLYYTCPDCGGTVYISNTVGDKFKCYQCGSTNDFDDFEQCSLWDFFDDVYDIDFIVNSKKEYEHCRIMVACGGPNIYINTWEKSVELYWWTDSAKYYLRSDIVNAVDDWVEEYYNCL